MKKILILAGRYLPGFKDGGPVRTLINLTDLLGDEYDFRLAVLDRDHGDTEPYPNIKINEWMQVGKAKVWYYAPGQMKFSLIKTLAKEVDLIYLCGFYNDYGYKTLILNRMGKLLGKPVVLASMGTFSKGALSHKAVKKKVFIDLCKMLGLFKNIIWSVTSTYEEKDVKDNIGNQAVCVIAEDPPRSGINIVHENYSDTGDVRLVFLSRVSPKKNLSYAAQILKKVQENITFDIYGPLEDQDYWKECSALLEKLPENVRWKYCGEVVTEKVPEIFSKYDGFLFPTKGENYGHVIFEALASGCIPIISDQTPWMELVENESGFVCALDDKTSFINAVDTMCSMSQTAKANMGANAVYLAKNKVEKVRKNNGYRELFERI